MARALKAPSKHQYICAAMYFPYYLFWLGSYKHLEPLAPQCSMRSVCSTQKPFLFHSPQWAQVLNVRLGSKTLTFDTVHWLMVRQPQKI